MLVVGVLAASVGAACAGGGSGAPSNDPVVPVEAGADVAIPVEAGPDAGGDCPAVCPPSSTENFCDNFNRADPMAAQVGWRLTPDNTSSSPTIAPDPCGHLVVDAEESVQMLERTLAETVSVIITFDLTMQITPLASTDDDAGPPLATVLALGASEDAINQGAGITVFYTATNVGVSIGNVSSEVADIPLATSRHFVLTVTGRASNLGATATLAITGGPDIPPAVTTHFTSVPFKVLQLGLRNHSGLGHATAQIDNLGVFSR